MILISRRNALSKIGLLAGVSILSGCAVNPVTGKRQLMFMSEKQEISLGEKAHEQIVNEYGSYSDSSMQEWFGERGKEMAEITHRKNLPWNFTVLDSPVINAFAVPGGYIYVTRGIIGYFNDEAQFAGVLGHELGHVNARHSALRYSKGQLANIGLALGSILSEEFAKYAQFASLGTTLLFLKFSRNDERQADKLGVEYSSAVGYDATHMSDFFKTLERMHPGGGSLPAWQSTHPDPGDRINATRKQAIAYQKSHSDMKFDVKRAEYLDKIDGIIFGDDPRQGYVKDNMFYHPEMKLEFLVPQGWKLTNQPSEVRMSTEKQNAILVFTMAPGLNPQDSASAFGEKNGITVTNTSKITVNGMSGIKTVGEMKGSDQTVGIISYYIQMIEQVYAFHGIAAPAELNSYDSQFGYSANGFNQITDESLLDVSPQRIEVRRIKTKSALSEVFNSFGVPEEEFSKLAVLNGMLLGDEPEVGTRVKIIA